MGVSGDGNRYYRARAASVKSRRRTSSGLGSLSQYDHHGRPLRDIFGKTADLNPYTAYVPAVSLNEVNPGSGRAARESQHLDFRFEDIADEARFNRVLWWAIKGERVPYPGTRRMSTLDYARAR